jgi:hypothetical protein
VVLVEAPQAEVVRVGVGKWNFHRGTKYTFEDTVTVTTPLQLAEELAKALPKQLKCVVLYGSAAAGDFVPGASNYNVLVIVDSLGVAEMDALSPAIVAWSRGGHPTPLFFTQQQLAESINAFPIEFLDIRQSHRILWGSDLLADMKVEHADLRRQVQRELAGKLLKLRGRYFLTAGKPDAITDLMLHSLSTFLVLFRAALRLYQDNVPNTKLDALHALAKHIPFDVKPFEWLFELKQHNAKSRNKTSDVSFVTYLKAIECVANAINRQTHPSGSKS